ncbi:Gamma-tubulin complex component 6 [Erysiphe necator]|nr:Gamma-tubulin complex component 6 [Erysiphe necator]
MINYKQHFPFSKDAFQIPDLWASSDFLKDVSTDDCLLFSGLKLHGHKFRFLPQDQSQTQQIFFSIPKSLVAPSILLDPVDNTISLSEPSSDTQEREINEEDLWLHSELYPSIHKIFKSWDPLENIQNDQIITPYVTEVNNVIFDTIIGAPEDYLGAANDDYVLINSSIFSSSLLAVGLGRNSVLFSWDEESRTFLQTIPKLRISGFTGETLTSLTSIFIECGNIVRSLQNYAQKSYSKEASPTRIALANSVNILLRTLELKLGDLSAKQKNILQLRALFEPAHTILSCFQKLINNTIANRSDESLLSSIFEDIQVLESRTDALRNILLQILDMISKPWLRFASEWLGLQPETGQPMFISDRGKSLVKLESKILSNCQRSQNNNPEYHLDLDKIPSFIAPDDARILFEVGKSLRLLKAHHPENPLVSAKSIKSIDPPNLKWSFSCEDILQVEGKALRYEQNVKGVIREYSRGLLKAEIFVHKKNQPEIYDPSSGLFESVLKNLGADILSSNSLSNQFLLYHGTLDDLSIHLHKYLTTNEESEEAENSLSSPPISLIAALSFNPIIAAQARIVNRVCIGIFFNSHRLRDHLSLQRDFQLFGNGIFAGKLTHLIFNRVLGNTQSGKVVELRLEDKNNWPLDSSEIQLALMGILTECCLDHQSPRNKSYLENRAKKSLIGGLSFALRDLSQEEIVKCKDLDGLEALDFLRISYQPPPPLDAVITPLVLYKYDELFKFLLRLNRMLYTVTFLHKNILGWVYKWQEIDQNTKRFSMEAYHFVSCVSDYFLNIGVNATWRIFEAKLDQIEAFINRNEDFDVDQTEGLDKLRDYHERVVDQIMFVLLLKKRQRPILELLEEIFRLILEFSKLFRQQSQQCANHEFNQRVNEIYSAFSKKIEVFISVYRGLSENKRYGDKRNLEDRDQQYRGIFTGDDLVEENTAIQLLARLELSGYYEKPGKS